MPLIFFGETSERYKGTTKFTMPTARPTMTLDNIRIATLGATALKIEPIIKIIAVAMIIFFRPKISAMTPLVAAPMTAPINTELTRNPCVKSVRSHVSFIKRSAPDITPVS